MIGDWPGIVRVPGIVTTKRAKDGFPTPLESLSDIRRGETDPNHVYQGYCSTHNPTPTANLSCNKFQIPNIYSYPFEQKSPFLHLDHQSKHPSYHHTVAQARRHSSSGNKPKENPTRTPNQSGPLLLNCNEREKKKEKKKETDTPGPDLS